LYIWAEHNRQQITISHMLEDYEDVAEIVRSWWTPEEGAKQQRVFEIPNWVIVPIIIIAYFATSPYLSHPAIAIPTGVVMVILFGWLLFRTVRNHQSSTLNKVISVGLLGIMLLGSLMRLLLVFTQM
jgi:hypothetical protein